MYYSYLPLIAVKPLETIIVNNKAADPAADTLASLISILIAH